VARLFALGLFALAILVPAQLAFAQDEDLLQPPEGQEVVLRAKARGVQIYECRAAEQAPGTFTWQFKEPAAQLRRDIIHYRGPTWQSSNDGSLVTGRLLASRPSDDPAEDIPDLLLEAAETSGDGVLSDVAFIQRLDSRGGVGPSGPCDPQEDTEVAVPYRATYVFWSPQPSAGGNAPEPG
jgi:hypothetical protein